jgi:hypothetical protein
MFHPSPQHAGARGQDKQGRHEARPITLSEAEHIGDSLGVLWDRFDVEQFRMGLSIESAHAGPAPLTEGAHDALKVTGKIALAHLNQLPDYYTQLAVMTCTSLRAFHTFRHLLL